MVTCTKRHRFGPKSPDSGLVADITRGTPTLPQEREQNYALGR